MAGAKSKLKEADAVGDWPQIAENQWYALAVTTAILTAIAIAFAFAAIFFDGFDGESDARLAQALAPFGVALFAMVTFCTVAWRGSVNVRQANQAEREGRAKLLQEGAKLLGESENPSHVSAGIATLEILVTGSDEKLAVQAMNLIADFVQSEMSSTQDHRFQEEAFAALSNGAKLGRVANRSIKFSNDSAYLIDWKSLEGVKEVVFVGGSVSDGLFGDFQDRPNYRYSGVKIWLIDPIEVNARFSKCKFTYCTIRSLDERFSPSVSRNGFEGCNFSDCGMLLDEKYDFNAISGKGNYYYAGRPPVAKNMPQPVWSLLLEEREPSPRRERSK